MNESLVSMLSFSACLWLMYREATYFFLKVIFVFCYFPEIIDHFYKFAGEILGILHLTVTSKQRG